MNKCGKCGSQNIEIYKDCIKCCDCGYTITEKDAEKALKAVRNSINRMWKIKQKMERGINGRHNNVSRE